MPRQASFLEVATSQDQWSRFSEPAPQLNAASQNSQGRRPGPGPFVNMLLSKSERREGLGGRGGLAMPSRSCTWTTLGQSPGQRRSRRTKAARQFQTLYVAGSLGARWPCRRFICATPVEHAQRKAARMNTG